MGREKKDLEVQKVMSRITSIPIVIGIPHERHFSMLNLQIFKKKDSCISKDTRSIVMGEADWNVYGRILFARWMMQNAEKYTLIPEEHFGGRRVYMAPDAALTKNYS